MAIHPIDAARHGFLEQPFRRPFVPNQAMAPDGELGVGGERDDPIGVRKVGDRAGTAQRAELEGVVGGQNTRVMLDQPRIARIAQDGDVEGGPEELAPIAGQHTEGFGQFALGRAGRVLGGARVGGTCRQIGRAGEQISTRNFHVLRRSPLRAAEPLKARYFVAMNRRSARSAKRAGRVARHAKSHQK